MIPLQIVRPKSKCIHCGWTRNSGLYQENRELRQVGILTLCDSCYRYIFAPTIDLSSLIKIYDKYHQYYYLYVEFLK